VERLASHVRVALENTLRDPEGLWILRAREEAGSELALTSWAEIRQSVRLDRIFRAGATPLSTGKEFLWIIDYKTSTPGSEGVEAFLSAERSRYAAQLESYARTMKEPTGNVRLALYYPLLPHLEWWAPEPD